MLVTSNWGGQIREPLAVKILSAEVDGKQNVMTVGSSRRENYEGKPLFWQ